MNEGDFFYEWKRIKNDLKSLSVCGIYYILYGRK